MSESAEVLMARLDERLKNFQEQQAQILSGQKEQSDRLLVLEQQMAEVRSSLTTQKPVIDEFITIKHKVVGAGQFGKWAWVVGASLVSFLIGSKDFLQKWLAGGQ